MSIRIDHDKFNVTKVIAREVAGHGGYESGKLTMDRTFYWSAGQYGAFLDKVNSMKFWTTAEQPSKFDPQYGGTDGAQWLLEGVAKDHPYHYLEVWTPESGSMRELGILVLRQCGLLDQATRDIY